MTTRSLTETIELVQGVPIAVAGGSGRPFLVMTAFEDRLEGSPSAPVRVQRPEVGGHHYDPDVQGIGSMVRADISASLGGRKVAEVRATPTSGTVRRLAEQGHRIGERWRPSDAAGRYEHRYAATGTVQADVGLAGADDVDEAVAAARAALPGWAGMAPTQRAAILFRLADLLERHAPEAAELAALDNGTPVSVMNPGTYTASWVRYYAGWCDKLDGELMSSEPGLSYVRLEPYGVVGAIPPWNGSMMGMGQKCGPALAAGNTVVAKPPEVSPFGMLRFAELALEAGLPAGVLNVVVGGPVAGEALAGHPGIDKISFTGGGATARRLMATAAQHLTPLAGC